MKTHEIIVILYENRDINILFYVAEIVFSQRFIEQII